MASLQGTISTASLRFDQVPSPDGSLDARSGGEQPPIWQFAASYSPPPDLPSPFQLGKFVTEAAIAHWLGTGEIPEIGLGGLRFTLWWLYHAWRHEQGAVESWEQAHPDTAGYVRVVVEKIGVGIFQEESWWWDPGHTPTPEEREERALIRANDAGAVGELYKLAAEILGEAIKQRDEGNDPFNLPLIEFDLAQGEKVYAAYAMARGLVVQSEGRSLEDAQALAYHQAARLSPLG